MQKSVTKSYNRYCLWTWPFLPNFDRPAYPRFLIGAYAKKSVIAGHTGERHLHPTTFSWQAASGSTVRTYN